MLNIAEIGYILSSSIIILLLGLILISILIWQRFVLHTSNISFFIINSRLRILWTNTRFILRNLTQIPCLDPTILSEIKHELNQKNASLTKMYVSTENNASNYFRISLSKGKGFRYFGNTYVLLIKKINDEVEQSQKMQIFKTAVDKNAASIVITDINGNIQYVNEKYSRLTGYSPEEAQGQNPRILKSGELSREYYENLWNTVKSGKDWSGEFHNKKKSGELYWERAVITPIKTENEITHFVAIKEDITELKMVENNALKYIEELEELNATKDKFFSIIAHDLKNPFAVIYGISEVLQKKAELIDDKSTVRFINTLESSVKQFYILLDKLLSWSRLQRGKITPDFQNIEVSEIFDNEIANYQMMAREKGVFIQNTTFPPIYIHSDYDIFSTIIRNLLSNAVKYSDSGDIVTLHAFSEGKSVFIFVQDEGVGMNEGELAQITKINTMSKPGTNNERGTGLGLTLVKDFAQLLRIHLEINSKPGVGTKILLKAENQKESPI